MDTVPFVSTDSPEKPPRKPRAKHASREDSLRSQLALTKDALRTLQKRRKQQEILRLGRLAFAAGLHGFPSEFLKETFAGIVERLPFAHLPSDEGTQGEQE